MALLHSRPTAPSLLRPSPAISRRRPIRAGTELRVCVNRTCNRSGSRQILQLLSDLAPAAVTVSSCGCLGRCGAGPNVAVLPAGVVVGHCGTAALAAELLADVCGGAGFDAARGLEALGLRKRGEAEMEQGKFAEAVELLSQAVDLNPCGGLHVLYKCRSAAKLAMGDSGGALDDVEEALRLAPMYLEAFICKGDVFMARDQLDAAEMAYSAALKIDPSLRRSKSFKARIAKVEEQFALIHVPS